MFSTDEINSATLISVEAGKVSYVDQLKFSIPAMGGPKEFTISRKDLTYAVDQSGETVSRSALVVGQTYDLEVPSYIMGRLKL